MSGYVKQVLSVVLMLLLFSHAPAQSRRELEQKKEALQKEINEASKQLDLLSKSKNVSLGQINALKKKIAARQALIATVNSEINMLDREIHTTGKEIVSLDDRMKQLKENYASLIRFASRNQDQQQRLMFLFASENLNQALRRMYFLQQINKYRRQQAAWIDSVQSNLQQKKSSLELARIEKTELRNQELKNKKQLDQEKKEQDLMLVKLQDRESKLRKELAAKKKAKENLEKAIANLIRKELDAARKKAAASGAKNVTNENVFTLTPEARKLSNNFAGNKGMLPWPVEKGIITSAFGEHPHPFLKGVTIKNDGVDIQTVKGSSARSVFEGEVSGAIELPGSGAAVIIRHGEYLSVYSNLDKVSVRKGDKVSTRQYIGTISSNDEGDKSEINLQIWKGFTKLNPQAWLAAK